MENKGIACEVYWAAKATKECYPDQNFEFLSRDYQNLIDGPSRFTDGGDALDDNFSCDISDHSPMVVNSGGVADAK